VSRTIAIPTVGLALGPALPLPVCGSTATYGKVLLDRGGRPRSPAARRIANARERSLLGETVPRTDRVSIRGAWS
jgi:hypothetical protein